MTTAEKNYQIYNATYDINSVLNKVKNQLYNYSKSIAEEYSKKNRHYHNLLHLAEMFEYVKDYKRNFTEEENLAINLAIIFHDIVYDTKSKTNEEDSFEMFRKYAENTDYCIISTKVISMVKEMIMATKEHNYNENLSEYVKIFIKADLQRLTVPFEQFWNYTLALMKEYAFVDWSDFKAGRLKFFEQYGPKVTFMGPDATNNINLAYHTLKVWEPKIAIYAGSFDDWHIGHQRILDKAEQIFDKVIIARGQNPKKPPHANKLPQSLIDNYQVEEYKGWITNFIKSKKYPVTLIRGLRNGSDLNGEINFSRYLQDIMSNIQIVSIFTDRDVEHLSSSGIKDLISSAEKNIKK